jgi:hypothetical protein
MFFTDGIADTYLDAPGETSQFVQLLPVMQIGNDT